MTDRELMQQALDVLENNLQVMKDDWQQIDQEWGPSQGGLQAAIDGTLTGYEYFKDTISTITALRQALVDADDTSQKRVEEKAKREHEWVGLTDQEIGEVISGQFAERNYWVKITKALESKLKEKNT